MSAGQTKNRNSKIPWGWLWWFLPKSPLVAAVLYAAYQLAVTRQFPSLEQAVSHLFLMVGGWLTSEVADIIVNRWQERKALEQLKSELEVFKGDLNVRLNELRSDWGTPILDVGDTVKTINRAIHQGSTRPQRLRIMHMLNHPAISTLHEYLEPYISSGSAKEGWQHFHLWKNCSGAHL